MTKQPYPEEFKIEAVKQITERGHRVADVSTRVGVSQHSLYKWIKAYAVPGPNAQILQGFTAACRVGGHKQKGLPKGSPIWACPNFCVNGSDFN